MRATGTCTRAVALAVLLVALSGPSPTARGQTAKPRLDAAAVDREVRKVLSGHGGKLAAAIWIGGAEPTAWYSWKSSDPNPAASAIKTAYLIELFDAYSDKLDKELPGLAAILKDDRHPALAPFSPEARTEIRAALGGASVRRIGATMMGQAKASNTVYNAAANLTTAALGGPDRLQERIHARDPEFREIHVRRYMLAPRDQPGDNEATAAALAAVLRKIASGTLKGVNEPTLAAIRGAIIHVDDPKLGTLYTKDGALNSDPITRVHSGWIEGKKQLIVFVIMTAQAAAPNQPRDKAAERLNRTADDLVRATLDRLDQ